MSKKEEPQKELNIAKAAASLAIVFVFLFHLLFMHGHFFCLGIDLNTDDAASENIISSCSCCVSMVNNSNAQDDEALEVCLNNNNIPVDHKHCNCCALTHLATNTFKVPCSSIDNIVVPPWWINEDIALEILKFCRVVELKQGLQELERRSSYQDTYIRETIELRC